MNNRAKQLAARRQNLQIRCALQREHLHHLHADIEASLTTVDRSIELVRSIARHPVLIVGVAAGLLALGPMRILRWASRGAFLFGIARHLGGYFKSREFFAPNRPRGGG